MRTSKQLVGILAAGLLLASCASGRTTATSTNAPVPPATFQFNGTVILQMGRELPAGTASCKGSNGYNDISGGTGVVVYDSKGEAIALGALKNGVPYGTACSFDWTVKTPAGQGIYSYEVSHRGKLTISEADARKGLAIATLGDK